MAILIAAHSVPVGAACDEMPGARPPGRDGLAVAMAVEPDQPLKVRGAMTVIDVKRRLLLTASHVVPGDSASFRFPSLDGMHLRTGHVLFRIPEADGIAEADGTAWAAPRDIALVVADAPLPSAIRAAPLRSRADGGVTVGFYGFPQGYLSPTLGAAQAAIPQVDLSDGFPPITPEKARCTRALVADTTGGDSGAAILDPNGYVVGVTFNGVLNGRRNFFVRSDCFFEEVVAHSPAGEDGGLYQMLLSSDVDAISANLAADGTATGIGNIDLYRAALRFAKDIAAGTVSDRRRAMTVLNCPIFNYMHERGLPTDTLTDVLLGSPAAIAAADRLVAETRMTPVPDAVGAARLETATRLYEGVIGDRLAGVATPAEVRRTFDGADAVVLKSYADAQIRLASTGDRVDKRLEAADRAAAVAAVATSSPALRGSALITVADVANRRSDTQRAVRALATARQNGARAGWLATSERYLRTILGLPRRANIPPLTANDLTAAR